MCHSLTFCVACAVVVWLLPGLSVRTGGQEILAKPRSTVPYDAVEAGADAHREQEEQRRQAIGRQLGVVEDMKWRSGLTSWYGGDTYYYRPYNLDSLYALGAGRSDRSSGPASRGFGPVFERWPYVPGDIWGYSPDRPVRQPIGQRQVQVNPNRWESFPVYADTNVPPAAPPVRQQLPPPPKAENGGPREF